MIEVSTEPGVYTQYYAYIARTDRLQPILLETAESLTARPEPGIYVVTQTITVSELEGMP